MREIQQFYKMYLRKFIRKHVWRPICGVNDLKKEIRDFLKLKAKTFRDTDFNRTFIR